MDAKLRLTIAFGATALLTAVMSRDAQASAIYQVTDLGGLSGTQLNDQGQVVGTGYVGGYTPTAPTYALLYNGYGGNVAVVGGPNSQGLGVNNSGQVVGNQFQSGVTAFLNSSGQPTTVGAPGASTAQGINDSGQIVGSGLGSPSTPGYGIESNGAVSLLNTPTNSTVYSGPLAINNGGQVAGTLAFSQPNSDPSQPPQTWNHATLWRTPGQATDLGTLGGKDSFGTGINASGVVVGYSATAAGVNHAFVFQSGSMQDLGTLGGQTSMAYGINTAGAIVGTSRITGDAQSDAFLFTNGKMLDLNTLVSMPPGLSLTSALAINNKGQILALGDAFGPNGTLVSETYLVTPNGQAVPADAIMPQTVPEPSVLAMVGLLGTLAGLRKTARSWRQGAKADRASR